MADLPMADRPDVVLPDPDPALARALADADNREEIAQVVGSDPTFLDGWAALAAVARDHIEGYAYARVGYHRGLDALRRHGWGGRGFVRWEHPSNRGFLRCLVALRGAAAAIGEQDEVERIGQFLRDLDPDWDDANVSPT